MHEDAERKWSLTRWSLLVSMFLAGIVAALGNSSLVSAQEGESDKAQMMAIYQWSTPYRLGSDLKAGDWVRYQSQGGQEIELKVVKRDKDEMVVVEKVFNGPTLVSEVHLRVDTKQMKLKEAFRVGAGGQKESTPFMDEKKVAEIVAQGRKKIEAQASQGQPVGWQKGASGVKTTVPAGGFDCCCLDPKFGPEQAKSMPPQQIEMMKQHLGMFFSEDVPRLIPIVNMMIVITSPEAFQAMKGGLVKSAAVQLKEFEKKK